ncbi:uncharacterized protein LOC120090034 [Benincasa hispida]|uniref:uncharacterized protein LOC120090034 n=1 Tax=Benincasa hispida TaxID=102211 RepID=UPI0019026594|nr:uncharacterized protein LOC120090034 [Benincasa hispida]
MIIDDLQFVLTEEFPPVPARNASQALKDAYDCWTKTNDKARVYILASLSDVLPKRHEVMMSACQIMESLQEMFRQMSIQIWHEAFKYIYNVRMKESQSVRKYVFNLMDQFNLVKMNGVVINEQSQVSFILEALLKSFLQFCSNVVMK